MFRTSSLAALLLATLSGCQVSGVAGGGCQYFGGACAAASDCCGGLYCSQGGSCAFPLDAGSSASSGGGSSTGRVSSGGAASSNGASSSASASSSGGASTSGGGGSSTGGASGFSEAGHSVDVIPNNGGAIIATPQVVTITFSNDGNRAAEEAFDAYLVTSPWLAAVGPEYGIHSGGSQNVELTEAAPTSIDDNGVESFLAGLIQAGTAPGEPTQASAVYLLFYPATTTLTIGGQAICDFAGGYHSSGQAAGNNFAYGVIPDCTPSDPISHISNIEWAASHEFIETCTDPLGGSDPAWVIQSSSDPWNAFGGEVADLCEDVYPQWSEGGYATIERVYSNNSALDGGPLCLPAPEIYYGADIEPRLAKTVAAGQQAVFTVGGWSTAALPPWSVVAFASSGNFTPTVSLNVTTLSNGQSGNLTVGVPAGTASQSTAVVVVASKASSSDGTIALAQVVVQ